MSIASLVHVIIDQQCVTHKLVYVKIAGPGPKGITVRNVLRMFWSQPVIVVYQGIGDYIPKKMDVNVRRFFSQFIRYMKSCKLLERRLLQ